MVGDMFLHRDDQPRWSMKGKKAYGRVALLRMNKMRELDGITKPEDRVIEEYLLISHSSALECFDG